MKHLKEVLSEVVESDTRQEIKEAAQDKIMQGIQGAFSLASDEGDDEKVVKEMDKQFKRIEKMFGYDIGSWNRGA